MTIPQGPPAWPRADRDILAALEAAYHSGAWGKYHAGLLERLEAQLAKMQGLAHAMTCCTGTFAVELALRGLKVSAGDEVILAGYDFSGNFRAIEALGARPVLVDIEPRTWCLDAAQIEAAISAQTKVILVSHLHGGMADMSAILDLAARHHLFVVEDLCQTPGTRGRGDVVVLSFGGSKLLTAGRGGAILTQHADVAQRAKIFCERGNDAFALSELQAAVLLPQLDKLAASDAIRQANADRLRERTRELVGLTAIASPVERGLAGYYKFAWLYDAAAGGGRAREAFVAAIQAEGVAIDVGFRGFATRSAARCRKLGDLPHSRRAAEQTLLLHHPVLLESPETITLVAQAIRKVLGSYQAN